MAPSATINATSVVRSTNPSSFCRNERGERLGQPAVVRAADKEDVQARDRIAGPELAHLHRTAADAAAGDDLRQLDGERVGAHHADRERAVRTRKALHRPLDVAAELVE